jgi:hypothetical protein
MQKVKKCELGVATYSINFILNCMRSLAGSTKSLNM